MKRRLFVCLLLSAAVCAAPAQEPELPELPDSTLLQRFEQMLRTRSDSLRRMRIRLPGLPDFDAYRPRRAVPATSELFVRTPPSVVLPTGKFVIGRSWSVGISNGQASNWGPYPDSFLDARTLSFPAPR